MRVMADSACKVEAREEEVVFYKIMILHLNKEKDAIQSLFNFFHKTVNSHNFETANHIAHIIFVLNRIMKTYLLSNQNAHTIQIIL